MALALIETDEGVRLHATTAALSTMLVQLAEASADASGGVDDDASEADLVDQVGLLERLRSAVAAAQAAVTMRLARARVGQETVERRKPEAVGRGLAEEIGLACRISPTAAARRLGAARAWWSDLPCTFAALVTGRLHELIATAVVGETRHLPSVTRRDVDRRLTAALLT